MYHSVAAPCNANWIDPANRLPIHTFDQQMRFLHQHRRVVSMSNLLTVLEQGVTPAPGTVVITFDDGYIDNLKNAAPILERYGFPALLYLPTSYVGRAQTQWIDELYCTFSRRTQNRIGIHVSKSHTFDLADRSSRDEAYGVLINQLRVATCQEREQILKSVAAQLRPDASPPRLTLNWDEVRHLVAQYPGFEIGVHTADHLDLSMHEDAAKEEIERCIRDVEREIHCRPRHFSFPYGRSSVRSRRAVAESGLQSAVVGGTDFLIDHRSDPLALSRLNVPRSMTLFRFWTSGAYPGLSRALFGHA